MSLDSQVAGNNGPRQVEIAIADPADLVGKPSGLEMVSPEELVHAMVLAFADAIRSKDECSDWARRKESWMAVFLSVPAAFIIPHVSGRATNPWAMAFNSRQAVLQDHESLSRTALQAAMELMSMKPLLEAGGYLQFKVAHNHEPLALQVSFKSFLGVSSVWVRVVAL